MPCPPADNSTGRSRPGTVTSTLVLGDRNPIESSLLELRSCLLWLRGCAPGLGPQLPMAGSTVLLTQKAHPHAPPRVRDILLLSGPDV